MTNLGLEVSPFGVAQLYRGLLIGYVIDEVDKSYMNKIRNLGMKPFATQTLMNSDNAKMHLAQETLKFAETLS
jgi:LPPG:FO 2-phospho-L-lactate transferase